MARPIQGADHIPEHLLQSGSEMGKWLKRFADYVTHRVFDKLNDPRPSSPAASDEEELPVGGWAWACVAHLMQTSGRHLAATGVLMRENQATGASATARANVEANLWLEWLLIPEGTSTRRARSVCLLLHEVGRGIAGSEVKLFRSDASDRLAAEAANAGFTVDEDKEGNPFRVNGEQKPKLTKLLQDSELVISDDGDSLLPKCYSQLSGGAHSTVWKSISRHDPATGGQSGDAVLSEALGVAMAAHLAAADLVYRYSGAGSMLDQPWLTTLVSQKAELDSRFANADEGRSRAVPRPN